VKNFRKNSVWNKKGNERKFFSADNLLFLTAMVIGNILPYGIYALFPNMEIAQWFTIPITLALGIAASYIFGKTGDKKWSVLVLSAASTWTAILLLGINLVDLNRLHAIGILFIASIFYFAFNYFVLMVVTNNFSKPK
jgi:hypothetical protein